MNRCRMELYVKQNARDTQMSTRVTEVEVVLPAQLANQNTVFTLTSLIVVRSILSKQTLCI